MLLHSESVDVTSSSAEMKTDVPVIHDGRTKPPECVRLQLCVAITAGTVLYLFGQKIVVVLVVI